MYIYKKCEDGDEWEKMSWGCDAKKIGVYTNKEYIMRYNIYIYYMCVYGTKNKANKKGKGGVYVHL